MLFKLYRITGDELYAELLRDVIHAHAEGIQPNGKITERLTYCDADSRGSRGDGGKTGWNETNGALMALEIPGVYIRTDLGRCYAFDHVKASLLEKGGALYVELSNPTAYDAGGRRGGRTGGRGARAARRQRLPRVARQGAGEGGPHGAPQARLTAVPCGMVGVRVPAGAGCINGMYIMCYISVWAARYRYLLRRIAI